MTQVWTWVEIVGILIQWIGVLALVLTLIHSQKPHRLALVPPSFVRARRQVTRLFRRRVPRTFQVGGSLGNITASATGSGVFSIGDISEKPIHERIEVLKRHVNEHAREISATQSRLSVEAEARAKADEKERLARESAIRLLEETLDRVKLRELRRQLWVELTSVVLGLLLVLVAGTCQAD